MAFSRYKLTPWFDSNRLQPAGFGIDVFVNGKWCHVLNDEGNGPLLIANEKDARMRGREIAAKLPALTAK